MKLIEINSKTSNPILYKDNQILVFFNNQPVIEVEYNKVQEAWFGINRDRDPDSGWGEFRRSRIEKDNRCEWVDLTPELKRILVEDICEYCTNKKVYLKLKEFDLLK